MLLCEFERELTQLGYIGKLYNILLNILYVPENLGHKWLAALFQSYGYIRKR